MEHTVLGESAPALEVVLQAGEALLAAPARLAWLSHGVVEDSLDPGLVRLRSPEAPALVGIVINAPSQIVSCLAPETDGLVLDAEYFLCAGSGVGAIAVEGVFERGLAFAGEGLVFLGIGGARKEYALDPGETLLVEEGHIVALDKSVGLRPGSGSRVALTGPGRVWVQTSRISHAPSPALAEPSSQQAVAAAPAPPVFEFAAPQIAAAPAPAVEGAWAPPAGPRPTTTAPARQEPATRREAEAAAEETLAAGQAVTTASAEPAAESAATDVEQGERQVPAEAERPLEQELDPIQVLRQSRAELPTEQQTAQTDAPRKAGFFSRLFGRKG